VSKPKLSLRVSGARVGDAVRPSKVRASDPRSSMPAPSSRLGLQSIAATTESVSSNEPYPWEVSS
jgi:hypothetical protein